MCQVVYCKTASQALSCTGGMQHKPHTMSGGGASKSRDLKPDYYFKIPAQSIGGGSFTNCQWCPLQICLLRDGAHRANKAGIWEPHGGLRTLPLWSITSIPMSTTEIRQCQNFNLRQIHSPRSRKASPWLLRKVTVDLRQTTSEWSDSRSNRD